MRIPKAPEHADPFATASPHRPQAKRRRFPWRGYLPAFLVLFISLATSAYIGYVLEQRFERHLEGQFTLEARELTVRIQERMAAYQQILRGGRGLFAASREVTREEWREYVKGLNLERNYRGIQGVGFAIQLPPAKLHAHIQAVRAQGFPHYTVWPQGQRQAYSAITYLEPFDGRNRRAFGYDMLSEAVRRSAMETARDGGHSTLSGKLLLVQEMDEDTQAGVLLYMPIYRNGAPVQTVAERQAALVGWVYSPFRMDDLMQGVLGRVSDTMRLRIYDDDEETSATLLYDSHAGFADTPLLTVRTSIEIAGHPWTLRYTALPGFVAARRERKLSLDIVGMGVIDLLLFAITWSLSQTRQRAEDMAERLGVSLRESEERYRRLIHLSGEGIFSITPEAVIDFVNPRFTEMLGYAGEELVGQSFFGLMLESDRPLVEERLARRRQGISETYEIGLLRKDGSRLLVSLSATPLKAGTGEFIGSFAMVSDIGERKRAEAILIESEERFRNLAQAASDAIITIDDQGVATSWNLSATRIFGHPEAEMLGQEITRIMPEHYRADHKAGLARVRESLESRLAGQTLELEGLRRDGAVFPIELALSCWQSHGRHYFTSIIRDISERKKMEAIMRHQASYDPLTGLPNRRVFGDRLCQEIARAARTHRELALLFIDLDHFKEVNDTFGHEVGDALLREAASRMRSCVRESDFIARLGGDEFTVILMDLGERLQAAAVAGKIIDRLGEPFDVGGHGARVSASIGIALCPDDGTDQQALTEKADKAMYLAKQAGRSCTRYFSDIAC